MKTMDVCYLRSPDFVRHGNISVSLFDKDRIDRIANTLFGALGYKQYGCKGSIGEKSARIVNLHSGCWCFAVIF
jgi:hypothetical protein